MEKLELKHLAPYLPYGLTILNLDNKRVLLKGITYDFATNLELADYKYGKGGYSRAYLNNSIKAILRPLSDLTKEIEHNGEKFIALERILIIGTYNFELNITDSHVLKQMILMNPIVEKHPYWVVDKLHEWHFDTKGLIEKGLAIDINTL